MRDLPILGRPVRLNVELRRVGCGACGKRMEAVSWLDRYSRMTRRLAETVIQTCRRLPTLHVAQLFGLHWDSVRLLERRALQAELDKLPVARPRRLVMDEFALFNIDTPASYWMPIPAGYCGSAKDAAAPQSGRSSKNWDLRAVSGLRQSRWT
ncbi:helix-turn-helix domain-containing protein [Pseudomonas corrugata]|nr:helix-turn-helix domain-containing protein [Pseudomonas corrugata]